MMSRSGALRWLVLVCALVASPIAAAQSYPTRPVRIVVPFSAGSQTDITTRMIGQKLTEAWGHQVVTDNRTGAGGTIGTGIVAEAQPDGYTLLAHSSGYAIAPALYPRWKVNMLRDFQGVTTLVASPHIVAISPKLGPKNLKDFLEYARKQGERFTWASAGVGSGTHFCGETFVLAAKLRQHNHVAYKGTPEALLDAMTGRVDVFFAPLGATMPFLKEGRVLAIAVTSKARNPVIPEVPTVSEAGLPGFEFDVWFILSAPGKTPKTVVEKISADVRKVLALPEIVKALEVMGAMTAPRTPGETQSFVAKELRSYAEVAKAANVPTF
jgi:tripartite-type tricarboxylate transporter receptor subunit TctC